MKEVSDCYDLWTGFKNKIHLATQLTLSDIRETLLNIKMTNNAEEYICLIRNQVEILKSLGKPMDPEEHFHYLRRGLPERFDNLRIAIRAKAMTPEEFADLIIEEESSQRGRPVSTTTAEANYTKSKFLKKREKAPKNTNSSKDKEKTLKCVNCPDMSNHTTENCRKFCKICKTKTHWTKNCKKKEKQEANVAETNDTHHVAKMMFTCTNKQAISQDWILDSGATNHIFNNSSTLFDLQEQKSRITVGNGEYLTSTHVGKTRLPDMILEGCLYAPNAIRNLISVHQLIKLGLTVNLSESGAYISGNGIKIPVIKNDRLFVIQPQLLCLLTHSAHKLVHRRLGHLGEKSLKFLLDPKNEMLSNYKVGKEDTQCKPCAISNIKKKKFGARPCTIATFLAEIIHTDVCGPFTPTVNGEMYYVTFTDDFSRFLTIYLLKTKNECFKYFKIFSNLIQNKHNTKIRRIHSDRGGEYVNKQWVEYCQENGITITYTPRKTPELNSVAESANRVLNWKIRAILSDCGLPIQYWGFAAKVSCLYKNLSPTSKKRFTPFEYWFKKKPTIEMLRVFGCLAYYKEEEKGKLSPQTQRGLMLGYDDSLTSYCIMNLETHTLFFTREARFDENTYPQLDGISQHLVNNEVDDGEEYVDTSNKAKQLNNLPVPQLVIPIDHSNAIIKTKAATPQIPTKPKTPIHPNYTPKSTPTANTIPHPNPQTPKTPTKTPNTLENSFPSSEQVSKSAQQDHHTEQEIRKPAPIPLSLDSSENFTQTKKLSAYKEFKLINEGKLDLGKRIRKPNRNFANFIELIDEDEPQSYAEAISCENKENWHKAMVEEMGALMKNETWDLVKKTPDITPIRSKWVYKIKKDENGTPYRFKARLVAVGSSQKEGIDFDEISSPVIRLRFFLNLAINNDLKIIQCDVESAYLYGKIDKDIFMSQPLGFRINENLVCKLKKSLYGLKQSGKIWNTNLTDFIKSKNYTQAYADPCLFHKGMSFAMIYVDDILLIGDNEDLLKDLRTQFSLKYTREPKFLLNVKIDVSNDVISLSQPAYISSLLKKYNMHDCKPKFTPADDLLNENDSTKCDRPFREAVGALIYLSIITRPDISFIVNVLARKMADPSENDWKRLKRLLRYLKATPTLGIKIKRTVGKMTITGYGDADFGGDADSGKSTSGIYIEIGTNPIIWKSKLQKTTSISTMESELYALVELVKEVAWLNRICEETNIQLQKPYNIFSDNQSTIKFITNSAKFHTRSKHISTKFHFIKEKIDAGMLNLQHVETNNNTADLLTKVIKGTKFQMHANRITNTECGNSGGVTNQARN